MFQNESGKIGRSVSPTKHSLNKRICFFLFIVFFSFFFEKNFLFAGFFSGASQESATSFCSLKLSFFLCLFCLFFLFFVFFCFFFFFLNLRAFGFFGVERQRKAPKSALFSVRTVVEKFLARKQRNERASSFKRKSKKKVFFFFFSFF